MRLDQTTRVYIGISQRLERLAKQAKDPKVLPPWQYPMSPAQQQEIELERKLKEAAERYVGGE